MRDSAPGAPFGGGVPGVDDDPADPLTTGRVLQFRVGHDGDVEDDGSFEPVKDEPTPAADRVLPPIADLGPIDHTRQVTLNEEESQLAGLYVWHYHIIEHEDNEMMRPYRVVPVLEYQPLGCDDGDPADEDEADDSDD